jgi:hypothetical protein
MLVAFSMFATWFADTVAVLYLPGDHGHKLSEQRGLGNLARRVASVIS